MTLACQLCIVKPAGLFALDFVVRLFCEYLWEWKWHSQHARVLALQPIPVCSPYQSAVWFSQTVTNFSNAGVQHGDVAYEKKTVCLKKQQLITACPESLASHLFIAPLSLI